MDERYSEGGCCEGRGIDKRYWRDSLGEQGHGKEVAEVGLVRAMGWMRGTGGGGVRGGEEGH